MYFQKSKGSWVRWITLPLIWSCVLGSIGWLVGNLGAAVFNPTEPLGFLQGIIVRTIAFFIGAGCGIISAFFRLTVRANVCFLLAVSVLMTGVTFYKSTPAYDLVAGTVIDAEIRNCRSPQSLEDKAIARWKEIVPMGGWWKQINVPDLLKKDQGVILDLWVYRNREIVKHQRKLWNYGQIEATDWQNLNVLEIFHAGFAGTSCTDYIQQPRRLYFTVFYSRPVDILLELNSLEFVPKEYQPLINN